MGTPSLLAAAIAIFALAFFARVAVLLGREPGGVDAWYYLCYARAFRRAPGFQVALPQYLLQDLKQSYAPVFPSLLGLLSEKTLSRTFWAISPAIDCITLALLFFLSLKLTASPTVALVASLSYAVSPTLISESRSLSPRSFGVLVHAISMVFLLRAVIGTPQWFWIAGAALSGALVFLSSATATASYFFVATVLSVVLGDARFLGIALVALFASWLLSFGHLGRVFHNYVHAIRFWIRHRQEFGSHPILDSPLYGGPREKPSSRPRDHGFLGQGLGSQMLRLLGENPFLLALPFANPWHGGPWTLALFIWAAALSVFAVIATVVWPLRAFGPGRNYMKSAIFPTAYVIAAAIGTRGGLTRPAGLATLAALGASVISIVFFVVYMRSKKHELSAHVPEGLRRLVDGLSSRPEGGVVCLPGGYSDYVAYKTERPVLWGSHSGSLDLFELVSPVWRERVETAARARGVRYLLLERTFVEPDVLRLDAQCALLESSGAFDLYDLQATRAAA